MAINPYSKYQEESILSMTQGEMLIKLYEEIIKQLYKASEAITTKKYEQANECLAKSQRIINHLISTLNFDYDISNNLVLLYDFFTHQIIQANIKKDPQFIIEIIPLVDDLRDAFSIADKKVRMGL